MTLIFNKELNKNTLLYMVSFSAGGLLGGAFFHLIPEASKSSGFTPTVSGFILVGILVSFARAQKRISGTRTKPFSREPLFP